jgi:tRNA uridine 5-carbamoylmethylation protein Kti12
MGNPDRFQTMKFSLTGIETKAREAIQQAEVSKQQFQKLAAMTGQLIVELSASMGRWDSGRPADRDARKEELLSTLRSIGLSKEELDQVSMADRKWVIVDYVNEITAAGYRHLVERANTDAGRTAIQQWSAGLATLTGNNIQQIETITADQLRDFLRRFDVLGDDEAALIDDYDYYLRTGKQRRPDVWAQRGSKPN